MKKSRFNYLEIIVFVHGKSELRLVQYIKSNLRIKVEIISERNGEGSIQINSLFNHLNNTNFKNKNSFLKKFDDVEHYKKDIKNLKIFMIMDVDDCSIDERKKYISKEMFKDHWLYNYLVPIYNINNLEDVMKKCNINIRKKSDYIEIFPVNRDELNITEINNFNSIVSQCRNTKLHDFINFCLEVAYKKSNNL